MLTAAHAPLSWRYDLDPATNPFALERMGINAVFNPGAIKLDGRYLMVARVEGADRKSFFAVAESANGVDGWRFWDYPVRLPQTAEPDVNVYDMRLTAHEDGWIYGVFCTERKDPRAPHDLSAAVAQAGIARTRDLVTWERLPDLVTRAEQQRNVVLHPEFVSGRYAFYTRPQDSFIEAGSGGGIGWGLCDDITRADVLDETRDRAAALSHDHRVEERSGSAADPHREGWLHLAHGVRNTAAGLRYVLYLFVSDRDEPWRVTHARRIPHRTRGRGARRRRVERGVQLRLDRRRRRAACSSTTRRPTRASTSPSRRGAAARLRAAHAGGSAHVGRLRGAALRADRAQPRVARTER